MKNKRCGNCKWWEHHDLGLGNCNIRSEGIKLPNSIVLEAFDPAKEMMAKWEGKTCPCFKRKGKK
jgi:hypothetical protein